MTADCSERDELCVDDADAGARCAAPGPANDEAVVCPDSGVDDMGTCLYEMAVWCDPDLRQTVIWDCVPEGLVCAEYICALGAACCPPE